MYKIKEIYGFWYRWVGSKDPIISRYWLCVFGYNRPFLGDNWTACSVMLALRPSVLHYEKDIMNMRSLTILGLEIIFSIRSNGHDV